MASITKKDIVRQIAEEIDVPQQKTKLIVQATFDAIIETLINEGRIELRNFGVFEVRRREARKARNPKSNETVFVEPKLVVVFQPGKKMEERVRVEGRTYQTKKPRRRSAEEAADADRHDESAVPVASLDGEATDPTRQKPRRTRKKTAPA